MKYLNYPKIEEDELIQLIKDAISIRSSSELILVGCNNVRPLIRMALSAIKKEKDYSVYLQRNVDFIGDMEITEIMTYDYYKTQFEDYCNYFDKYKVGVIGRSNKQFYNYSKDHEIPFFKKRYPTDINMVVIVENFNFLDLESQAIIRRVHESYPNIIVIGQLRNDFDFATTHLDSRLHGRSQFCYLEEN